jgi:2-keto-3-deoxy-L-rhamnonate aldolase RhmA
MSDQVHSTTASENPVKQRLREGRSAIGVTITVNNVEIAAQAAALGFDFLWIEMEHSPVDLATLRNIVLATRGLRAVPFARVPVNELWTAKRVLDAGVLGVIFPFTSTPALAQQAAAACRYPPAGRRGSGAGLASFRWPPAEDYYDFADRNVLVTVVIEEVSAVQQIDAIAATPGVDVLFVGPSDLSFSLGFRGQMNHPVVEEAIAKVLSAAQRHGKIPGRLATTPAEINRAMDQGFRFLQTSTELSLMAGGAEALLSGVVRPAVPAPPIPPSTPRPAY